MRSDDLRPAIVILAMLCVGVYLFYTPESAGIRGAVGNVLGQFTAQATVVRVDYDPTPVQLSPVIANGPDVQMSINATQYAASLLNVTIAKPEGYETGFGWQQTSPTAYNISDSGENIHLELDPAVENITLQFRVRSPVLATEYVSETSTAYAKGVMIGSESHLVNVTASAAVSPYFSGYLLYEIDGAEIDRTEEYHLQVNGSTATWSGFNLSAKEFKLVSTNRMGHAPNTSTHPGGSGGGGGGWGCYTGWHRENRTCVKDTVPRNVTPPQKPSDTQTPQPTPPPVEERPQELQRFTMEPEWVVMVLPKDTSQMVNLTVRSETDAPLELTYRGTTEFLGLQPRSLTLEPHGQARIPLTIGPLTGGEWLGRIIISDGVEEKQAFFDINVPGPAQKAARQEQPASVASMYRWDLFIVLLIVIAVFALLLRRRPQAKRLR